ncbi:hypothetical protein PsYK624_127880 [Phanerochaete sordida]|uniref:Uncharacterized protein n=1 Tax=Phanerochaete sordida TaxID=48140 RepID=A0A9P3GNG3_9APHY|nr:hypothetical protein PsYK624_127880 [Phanerochaete sordida]
MASPPTFSSLRLTEEAWAKYKQSLSRALDLSSTGGRREHPKVRVTGYNIEARDAIVASNGDGSDFIEAPWSPMDSVNWIMQRIGDKLRIPINLWVLAGQGHVLSTGLIVGGHDLFKGNPSTIELVLVPINYVEDYEDENPLPDPERYVWRHLEPGTTESTDPMEKAKAEYHLIDPVDAPEWETYYAQRKAADVALGKTLDDIDEIETVVEQIKECVQDIVGEFELEENEQFAIADCVYPRSLDIVDSGDLEPRTATILTRIYSPTRPAAVDVWFHYHHRTRWESVEFTCSLLFRVVNPLTEAALPPIPDPVDSRGRVARGWTRMFWMALDDCPPGRRWYAKSLREWGMRAAHVNRVHAALFGGGRAAAAVDKVDAVRLLLASVGIAFYVAREDGEDDEQNIDRDKSITWECFEDKWIGLNIREACGVPLDDDADWEPPADENPYEDEEDDEYGDSEDEGRYGGGRDDCRPQ